MENYKVSMSKVDKIFAIVMRKKNDFVIAVGNAVVSEKVFKTKAEAESYIEKRPYELIVNTTAYILTQQNKINNERNNKENAD